MKRIALAVAIVVGLLGHAFADEPQAKYQLERGSSPHAGLPFTLLMGAFGFDESPAPEQPKLEIPGAKVTPLGAQPNVSRSMQIINGRRTDSTQVTWVLKWRVEVAKEGQVQIPSTTVTQGGKHATAQPAELQVDSVPSTDDMKLELQLPDRPVFVGETVDVKLVWQFRRQPEDQSFTVPLASMDEFTVSAPPVTDPQRRMIELAAGAKTLQLPYDVDATDVGGQKWNRVTIRMFAAPRVAGKVEVPASSVVASMPTSRADFFGNVQTRLMRSSDVAHALEVKPLPESDRPASFAGAVGSQFSIAVGTSRSVVQLGEPVELAITVKSNQRLDTLALGKLDREGGLPKDKFTVPDEQSTGELSDDGKTKTFKVTAQVTGPATEVPAIAFSYFDPVKSTYQTIHSDPIALSVKGGSIVGAGDVVAMAPKKTVPSPMDSSELALVGADRARSAPGDPGTPLGGALLWLLVARLYAVPLGVFGVRSWQVRTQTQREEAAEVRAARKRVEQALAKAARDPARETAGPLAAAIRAFARTAELELDDDGLLARLETESFAPSASSSPLPADLRLRVEDLMKRWSKPSAQAELRRRGRARAPRRDHPGTRRCADAGDRARRRRARDRDDALVEGRAAYQDAMTVTDASARKAAFTRAAASLGDAARAAPGEPELLADWGNAALGAGDVSTATLAYRRALVLDGSNVRAHRNLAWLRGRQPDVLRPTTGGAADALFFFHDWPRPRRLLVGALAFAIVVLLLVPWTGKRRRGLAMLALLPAVVWIVMVASVALEDRHADDAVVMDAVVMRAADSAGAPAALTQPLPRGTEVTLVERRDTWTKIRIASGAAGWVPDGAVERVAGR